jgi:hypothetical protein
LEDGLRGKRTLEIGCADGYYVEVARRAGADATGIDLFEDPQVSGTMKGDFMTAPLQGPYNFIFAFGVFERCAIYSPAGLVNGEFWRGMQEKFPPGKMLARLRELLANDGECLFSTYVQSLLFTKDMARQEGFEIRRYVKTLNSERYGDDGTNRDVVFSPEVYYTMTRSRRRPVEQGSAT